MPVSSRLASTLRALAVMLVALLVVFLGSGFYLYRLSLTLPDVNVDVDAFKAAQTSTVFAADGSVLAEWHGEEDRRIVPLEDIPQHLRDAVVAIEDERFYSHHGVDLKGIGRALRINAERGSIAQGGSTITQQLVKILFTEGDRTLARKIREALLSYELEARTDKDTVLETYLNTVYFGHGAYGVESASRRFFGKGVADLDLAQAATLAGLIRSPGHYSPVDAPEDSAKRRDTVLQKMRELGYISAEEDRAARETVLEVAPPKEVPHVAPYFVEYVRQEVVERVGEDAVYRGGIKVYTTLDPHLQAAAERAATAYLSESGDPECALVALEHESGRILALVGGHDFSANQFNLAVQGRRQPGSAFKPFVLARALEEGVRPDQVFDATPYSVKVKDGVWNVQNYENAITAPKLTLSAATNWSVNCVYARLIMQVGPEDVADAAKRMGITTPIEPNPAIALGGLTVGVSPLEMASAYGTLANKGTRVRPTGIVSVVDDSGSVLYEPGAASERAVAEPVAVQASFMLHDVVENGTGQDARIPGTWVAGKTGTTQSYRDAWFVGYAEDLSCAVWVGHREGQVEMTDVHGIRVTGGSYPARIWKGFMEQALVHQRAPLTPSDLPAKVSTSTPEPTGVLVSICPDSMMLANKRCPSPVEMYLDPALAPKATCNRH